jgi:hypothetical protein
MDKWFPLLAISNEFTISPEEPGDILYGVEFRRIRSYGEFQLFEEIDTPCRREELHLLKIVGSAEYRESSSEDEVTIPMESAFILEGFARVEI